MLLAWRKRSPRDAMCLPHRSFPRNYGISTTTSTGPSAGRTNRRLCRISHSLSNQQAGRARRGRRLPWRILFSRRAEGYDLWTHRARARIGFAVEKREEEFPAFTKFWLRRPERFAKRMTIFAMLEGRNVTGAYHSLIEPGMETRMHVRVWFSWFPVRREHQQHSREISARKSTIRTAFSFSVAMASGCGIRWHGRGSCSGVDSTCLVRAPLTTTGTLAIAFSKLRLDSGS